MVRDADRDSTGRGPRRREQQQLGRHYHFSQSLPVHGRRRQQRRAADQRADGVSHVDSDLQSFSLTSTLAFQEYDAAVHRDGGFFHPPRPSLLVLSPRSPVETPVLSHAFMRRALDIVNEVYDTTVVAGGVSYGFADLCHPSGDAEYAVGHGGGTGASWAS